MVGRCERALVLVENEGLVEQCKEECERRRVLVNSVNSDSESDGAPEPASGLNPQLMKAYASFDEVSYSKITELNKRLIDSCSELSRYWNFKNEAIRAAIFVDDLLYSQAKVIKQSAPRMIYHSDESRRLKPGCLSFLQYVWYVTIQPVTKKVVAGFCAMFSILLIAAECAMYLRDDDKYLNELLNE